MSACLIVYDDCGIRFPMTWDKSCEGAVCCANGKESVVVFQSRADARRAVTISARFAALEKAQAKEHNSEFLIPGQIQIVPIVWALATPTKGANP